MIAAPRLRPSDRFLLALYNGDVREAVEIGSGIVQDSPDDVVVTRSLARLLTELGELEQAFPYWSRLLAENELDIEACYHTAKAEMARGGTVREALAKACDGEGSKLRPVIEPLLTSPAMIPPATPARHVAIAGVSYCGSTLFDRLLGGLPGVRSIGESHWLIKTYENKVAAPIDFTDHKKTRMLNCTVCGPRCEVLTLEFRTGLAADHSNWYFRIARQLGTDIIVSADKNPSKLIENDPLLRMDMLVLFKSPEQAWISQLDKLPKGLSAEFYLQELEKYIPQWCRTYEAFLDQFHPTGKIVFVSFDSFVKQPNATLRKICSALDLPFDERVLSRTLPGHAIGGNGRAMARLREADYAVTILPLDEPRLAADEALLLDENTRMKEIHAELMLRFGELEDDGEVLPISASGTGLPDNAGDGNLGGGQAADDQAKPGPVALQPLGPDGRIARFPLPSIHAVHHEGIFGDFSQSVQAHLTKLEQMGTPSGKVKAGFFRHLLASIDSAEYREIQRRYLAPENRNLATLKYLDPVQWFDVKLTAAIKLDLHRRPPISILDLGTGPGHFAAIAQYFGHSVLGADVPSSPEGSNGMPSMYDALCDIFGVQKIGVRLEAFHPLPAMKDRFDLVCSFMPTFNAYANGKPWAIDAWRFLLDDIQQNVLTADGGLFLQFANGRISDAIWEQMVSEALWSNEPAHYIYIEKKSQPA